MAPSGEDLGVNLSHQVDEDGQWEDYTCQGQFEELIRSFETVLREWGASDRDLVISAEDGADSSNVMGTTPQSTPRTSYSRCLEHDGQLFSIQVVPPPDPRAAPHGDPPTSPTANTPAHKTPTTPTSPAPKENRTVSAACHLEDRRLDFTGYGDPFVTPLHRWFGLKQYVLLRALGQGGLPGMGLDQLLWAMTLAAGNCKCSVPVLVSCDWDGLVEEEAGGGGASGQSGASCRGYSAPGSKGVACSVRFQTAWTEKPPPECLYLNGLADLFLAKIVDAHCLPGRTFAPVVSATVQQSWEWTKPMGEETTIPAPGLPWDGGGGEGCSSSSGSTKEEDFSVAEVGTPPLGMRATGGVISRFPVGGGVLPPKTAVELGEAAAEAARAARAAAAAAAAVATRERKNAVRDLLLAAGRAKEEGAGGRAAPLWGPKEDPLVSLHVRVRWTELREGLVEESPHFTTLDPLPAEPPTGFSGSDNGGGDGGATGAGAGGRWFVSPRWRHPGDRIEASNDDTKPTTTTTTISTHPRKQEDGRLGDACCRLLAALVLTTAMHPGTLMADLGATPLLDGPTAMAQDYGKAASAMLSAETRWAVEEMCSRAQTPSIKHDEIDQILRHLLHSQEEEAHSSTSAMGQRHRGEASLVGPDGCGKAAAQGSTPSSSASRWRQVYVGAKEQQRQSRTSSAEEQQWMQVYPPDDGIRVENPPEGEKRFHIHGPEVSRPSDIPAPKGPSDSGRGGSWGPWSKLSVRGGGGGEEGREAAQQENRSLWVWAERGGAPIGRLLSLLSLQVANCEDLGSMSLLWMSFVRDVRLLWEDGATIARMGPMPEVDGTSMFDGSVNCTDQDRSVASRLRAGILRTSDADGGDDARDLRSSWVGVRRDDQQDRLSSLYPDTRMCLIWQKLQMLNCCRAEVVGEVELQPSPSPSPGVSGSAPWQGGGVEDAEDEDEEEAFFDTQEYYQTSEDEDCFVGAAGGGHLDDHNIGRSGGGAADDGHDGNTSAHNVEENIAAAKAGVGDAGNASGAADDGDEVSVREEEEGSSASGGGGDGGHVGDNGHGGGGGDDGDGDSDKGKEGGCEGDATAAVATAAAAEHDVTGDTGEGVVRDGAAGGGDNPEGQANIEHSGNDGSGSTDLAPLSDARQTHRDESPPALVPENDTCTTSVSSNTAAESTDSLTIATDHDEDRATSTGSADAEGSSGRVCGGAEDDDHSVDGVGVKEAPVCETATKAPVVAPAAAGAPSTARPPVTTTQTPVEDVDEACPSTLDTKAATIDQQEVVPVAPAVSPGEQGARRDEGGGSLVQSGPEGREEELRQDEEERNSARRMLEGREEVMLSEQEEEGREEGPGQDKADEPSVQSKPEEREEGPLLDEGDESLVESGEHEGGEEGSRRHEEEKASVHNTHAGREEAQLHQEAAPPDQSAPEEREEGSPLDEGDTSLVLSGADEGREEGLRRDEEEETSVQPAHERKKEGSQSGDEDSPLVRSTCQERGEGSRSDGEDPFSEASTREGDREGSRSDEEEAPLVRSSCEGTEDDAQAATAPATSGEEEEEEEEGPIPPLPATPCMEVVMPTNGTSGDDGDVVNGVSLTSEKEPPSSPPPPPPPPPSSTSPADSAEKQTISVPQGPLSDATASTATLLAVEPSPTALVAPAAVELTENDALSGRPEDSAAVLPSELPSPDTPDTRPSAVGTGDEPPAPSTFRLLCTGQTMRLPELEESGPVTGDMLRQQGLGQAAAYRGREVLLADMKAFREANDGGGGSGAAVFADFVRWYRSECWQEATTSGGRWIDASGDRSGGRAEDDKRLAWPGQGQVLWKIPPGNDPAPAAPALASGATPKHSSADPLAAPTTPSTITLAGWLSCWGYAGTALHEGREEHALAAPCLFKGVKEGEKALHFLETISPGPLLVQLLSALLGLSIFILEEACSGAGGLPGVQSSVETARRKVVEAVELLASAATAPTPALGGEGSSSSNEATTAGIGADGGGTNRESGGGDSGAKSDVDGSSTCGDSGQAEHCAEDCSPGSFGSSPSLSPFRRALLAADDACVAVKRAETALARAVSLQRSLPGQKDLVNAIVIACGGDGGEAPVSARPHKEFLRDLLLAQGIQKTPGSELDDLLASYDDELKDAGSNVVSNGAIPPPQTKEYVLRCQTPAPFYSRNVGRGQIDAYPTTSSRMYAKTDGKNLRVALSLCESDI